MHSIKKTFYIAIVTFSVACDAYASALVYTPVNPNFGGNPNNGGFLLQEATDNNHFVAKAAPGQTPAQLLQSSISDTLYSQIANKISTDLGTGKTTDTFTVGNDSVTFTDNGVTTSIAITNTVTHLVTNFSYADGI